MKKCKQTFRRFGGKEIKLCFPLSPFCKDAEVGDGTTSVVLLASEFLAQLRPYIEEGVHPQVVIRAMRKGTKMAVDKIKEIAVQVGHNDSRCLVD